MSENKSGLFLHYWNLTGGQLQPDPEYKFLPLRRFRFDWAFPVYRVAVEVDGGVWLPHGGRHGTDKDREKLNLAAANGWLVLRFSPEMLNGDPEGCCEMVRDALTNAKEW